MPQTTPSARDSRWLSLSVLCAGMLMIVLDSTVVNVALPSIRRELGFTQSSLAWVVNAYLIPFGGLLLLAGRLGDLVGRKRIFLGGLMLFTVASLLCAVSESQGMLIASRFVQGVGGAMTSTVMLGVIVASFPQPHEKARAVGILSFIAAAGGSSGLLVGGALTQAIGWHWIFFVNVPIGIATALLAARLLGPDKAIGLRQGADVAGALFVTAALMLGVYTIFEAKAYGESSTRTFALGTIAAALFVAFLVRQGRAVKPLMPLGIFWSRNATGANLILICMQAGMFGAFFLGPLYMQVVLGYEPVDIGLAFLPCTVAFGIVALRFSARLSTRFGARPVLLLGMSLVLAGLALFARTPIEANFAADILPPMLLIGVGGGLSFPLVTILGMSGATASDSGLFSGLLNTTQQIGSSLGLAVLASLAAGRTDGLLAAGQSTSSAQAGGFRLAFAIGTGRVVVAILVAATLLKAEATTQEAEAATEPALTNQAA